MRHMPESFYLLLASCISSKVKEILVQLSLNNSVDATFWNDYCEFHFASALVYFCHNTINSEKIFAAANFPDSSSRYIELLGTHTR